MRIFLSWSGHKSHQIALAFSEWIPCVIQAVKPWVSSKDIDRGSIWFNEIIEQLKDTNFGIVFVTNENQDKPWLLFETGALSKGLTENKICTVLVDLEVRDIDSGSPLRQINHTVPDKNGFLSLVKTINKDLDIGQLQEKHLETSFNALWNDFESKIITILESEPVSQEPRREDTDVLNDILDNVININRKVNTTSRFPSRHDSKYINSNHAKTLLEQLSGTGLDREFIEDNHRRFNTKKMA